MKLSMTPGVKDLYRDERATPGLDDARITTLTTLLGIAGSYVTQGLTLAPQGSDFALIQNRRVLDKANRYFRIALARYQNESIRVNGKTGRILEREAAQIERFI